MAVDFRTMENIVPQALSRLPKTPQVPMMNLPLSELTQEQQDFLSREIDEPNPDDPSQPLLWRGTKMLGEGGFGKVGLWELENPHLAPPDFFLPNKLAIKESKLKLSAPTRGDLTMEKSCRCLWILCLSGRNAFQFPKDSGRC